MDGNQVAQGDGLRQVIVGTGGRNHRAGYHRHPSAARGEAGHHLWRPGAESHRERLRRRVRARRGLDLYRHIQRQLPSRERNRRATISCVRRRSISIPRGSSGGKDITVKSFGGFDDPVTMSLSGLPTGVTATWSPNPVDLPLQDGDTTSRATLRVSSAAHRRNLPHPRHRHRRRVTRTVGSP
jgi:hypothetical protein